MKAKVGDWIIAFLIGIASGLATWILIEFWKDKEMMKHIISFLVTFSPVFIGLLAFSIYWFVKFQINVYRLYKYYGTGVGNRVKKVENEILNYNVRIQYLEKVSAKMWDLEKAVERLKPKEDVHV